MRPTHREGEFHVGIVGVGWDPEYLMDEEKFVNFIHEKTGRRELKFRDFSSMNHWKSVTLHLIASTPSQMCTGQRCVW